jgi:hypothetical protein
METIRVKNGVFLANEKQGNFSKRNLLGSNHLLQQTKLKKTAKEEGNTHSHSLVAWSMVFRPKDKGGLGILNLELQNKALLMKQLHKFYTKLDVPWVHLIWSLDGDNVPHACSKRGSFWWKDIFSFVDDYRAVTQCVIGNGSSVLFWKDFWSDGTLLCEKFPRLFSFAISEDTSVAAMYGTENILSHFMLPISVEAYQEL